MLEIKFAQIPGHVRLDAPLEFAEPVQLLRSKFPDSEQTGPSSFTISLADLLSHLAKIGDWEGPHDGVVWESGLRTLVETSVEDAQAIEPFLDGAINEAQLDQEGASEIQLGDAWLAGLTDFQERDIRKIARLNHGANFSVPGAGKTRVALALFQMQRMARTVDRMLVIAPKSAFESWSTEVELCFAPGTLSVKVFDGQVPAGRCDVLLANYDRLPQSESTLIGWLAEMPALLVLDEAHRMKAGADGAWGTACFEMSPYARRRLILSGTPVPNGAADLENLFAFVWPGEGKRVVRKAVGNGNLRQAGETLRRLFARTNKAELGLPDVQRKLIMLDLPPRHRQIYDALIKFETPKVLASDADLERLSGVLMYLIMAATTPALLSQGTTRYEPLQFRVPPLAVPGDTAFGRMLKDLPAQELAPKYAKVQEIVANNTALGRKTLVWSNFVRNLTSMERYLAPFEPAIVHGATQDRAEQLKRFREDAGCSVLLANPATLGEGVSLHKTCNDAIYVDRDFAAGRFIQSVDRIHRLGLAADVETTVTILASRGTIDEVIADRLQSKIDFMSKILSDSDLGELAELSEAPEDAGTMNKIDMGALVEHVRSANASD